LLSSSFATPSAWKIHCHISADTAVGIAHGTRMLARTMPREASSLYARNVFELATVLLEDGRVRVDSGDEIVGAALLTHEGDVVHGPTAERLEQEGRG
jgi:NAD(P) transhydrogenase subunit alpha